jgi:hypothetical protein
LEEAITWAKREIVASPPSKQALKEWFDILTTLLVIFHHSQQTAG